MATRAPGAVNKWVQLRQSRGLGMPPVEGLSARPFQAIASTIAQRGVIQRELGTWQLPQGTLT
eukprot:5227970-Alexandrium_andersonii.AAC.1